jgi:DNA replication and repair protein RecF
MFLEKVAIVNFRNYVKAEVNPSKINLIFGLNAHGKTNILEAIYLLCLGRSFRTANNQELIRIGDSFFIVEGNVVLDSGIKKKVVIQFKEGKKEIAIDHKRLRSHSDIFGNFPIVVFSPEDYRITSGGPSERRRFLDLLLSQVSVKYLTSLQEYVRILKQRNKILQNIRDGLPIKETTLEPWTQQLVNTGSEIVEERYKFINDFSSLINPIYKQLTNSEDELRVSIESSIFVNESKSYQENFHTSLLKAKSKERLMGVTLVGPHRDDIIFQINGLDLRKFGSRGEHKSVLISIKMAEIKFINRKKDEKPILLLDDYYSELDKRREENILHSLQGLGQIFLTSPKESAFNTAFNFQKDVSFFYVEDGQIEKKSTRAHT